MWAGEWSPTNMFCDSTTEFKGSYANGFHHWCTKNYYKGVAFIAQLESSIPVIGIKLRNTYNGGHEHIPRNDFTPTFWPSHFLL